ncbi:putative ABC transport system permease protein [Actinacidiphila rubida]|uniref:Putative ABC transport system permease protein n=1 Tax=Actinacidiphila rubida TaxID=310780 RepID=A0A1H8RRS1_9ACTN|nr:FtsX-like permease family protein [Actinacidiphila rubida]SEO69036.1 putative ABC transport system permease protein [Actinacidiphila rubida]
MAAAGLVLEGRGRHGGLPARHAVVRWSWRMLRREWRRQVLLLTLVACTVGAAVCGLSATHAYNATADGTFGSARAVLHMTGGSDPARLGSQLGAAATGLAPDQIITHRSVPVPGSVATLDVRGQDPHGRIGSPRLRLLDGRYPAAGSATEIALTPSAAREFHARLGGPVTLGGHELTVVGLVENPAKLDDTFALAVPAGTAATLVAGQPATTVDVLTDAPRPTVQTFRPGGDASLSIQYRQSLDRNANDAFILAVATVALLLVALVATAGFAVVAQRRLRQIGMLGAMGATDRQLRLVLVGHGLLTGLVGTAAGAVLGAAAWVPVAPLLERPAGHRIDRLDVPWLFLAVLLVVAVLSPTAAAWWPARAVARVPAVQALSARPPAPVRARQSVAAAVVLLAGGVVSLVASHRTNGLLVSLGIVGVVGGVLLFSPLVVRALAATAGRMPFTTRLVLRDLGRHQARSGAALAAITLAIGLPVAISVLAGVNQSTPASGNLSAHEVLLRTSRDPSVVPLLSAADMARQQSAVDAYAARLGATAVPLTMAYDPDVRPMAGVDGKTGRLVVDAGHRTGSNSWSGSSGLWVATPATVHAFGLDPASAAGAALVTRQPARLALDLLGSASRQVPIRTVHVAGASAYTSEPANFLTPEAVAAHRWRTAVTGWYISAPHDLTDAQRSAARDMAATAGLVSETRAAQAGLGTLRWASVAAGAALALGVLAMTVGTIRAESADDLRTLTATGAGSGARRALTAATAGALALAGTLLGAAGAYAVLVPAYARDLGLLRHVPYLPLTTAIPGVPLLALATGWLIAGREPAGIARRLLE